MFFFLSHPRALTHTYNSWAGPRSVHLNAESISDASLPTSGQLKITGPEVFTEKKALELVDVKWESQSRLTSCYVFSSTNSLFSSISLDLVFHNLSWPPKANLSDIFAFDVSGNGITAWRKACCIIISRTDTEWQENGAKSETDRSDKTLSRAGSQPPLGSLPCFVCGQRLHAGGTAMCLS